MLQGNMPLELFSLQSLEKLSLANNQLSGQIDVLDNGPNLQTFQRLTNLTYLDLSYNNFSGDWELDALLSSVTNLELLKLSYSGISVTTSNANHYVNLGLRILSLATCSLKVFPVSIKSMTNLVHLDLSNNDIQGHIPDWIGETGRNQLSILDLSNNSITGTIPNVFGDWSW
ncbi:putative leucine-rich repeat domain superfamily [Helianthus anomalus]